MKNETQTNEMSELNLSLADRLDKGGILNALRGRKIVFNIPMDKEKVSEFWDIFSHQWLIKSDNIKMSESYDKFPWYFWKDKESLDYTVPSNRAHISKYMRERFGKGNAYESSGEIRIYELSLPLGQSKSYLEFEIYKNNGDIKLKTGALTFLHPDEIVERLASRKTIPIERIVSNGNWFVSEEGKIK